MRTVTVVGASLSGVYAARELRTQGFDGRLVIVGDEPHRPYDRPPLSKDFLTGRADEDQLALTDAEETAELDAEWLLGVRARGLDARGRTVLLDNGRTVSTDGVVIATGAAARRLPGDDLAGCPHSAHPRRRPCPARGTHPGPAPCRRHRRRLHRRGDRLLVRRPRP